MLVTLQLANKEDPTMFLALPILSALAATAMAATDVTTDADMESTVKALIDAGTCDEVSANDDCVKDTESYYHTFEYDGSRIVISSGCPDHMAEWNTDKPKKPQRCEFNHWERD